MRTLEYVAKSPDMGGWKGRHLRAVAEGTPVTKAIQAWLDYASSHKLRYQSKIGDDYVLGDAWAAWGFALRCLLNGDLHGCDGGTLDTILCDNLTEQGWDCDMEERAKP